ncbi:alginate O-acetyltransferase AlgF [Shimia sp. R11_0]|uniref:alginate O-acetyltransferase AlgF n=1 Tax=Shimia sp. R11_0 TaxID=2821096 RepID=UPI001ADAC984|nr:alginate O-acetyltransferase AlgF [Shimia sp. R11_0]MBO9476723.1 alginate O-acetyltransferase AlgF [Shimia sp. R11_0]
MLGRHSFFAATIAACCVAMPLTGMAQDAALYEEAIPDDAAFVRVFDTSGDHTGSIEVSGATFSMEAANKGHYVPISASKLTDGSVGHYLSAFRNAEGTVRIIEEPARSGAGKVHLILLNADVSAVRLTVAERGVEVVSAVEAGDAGIRAVNPVAVRLAVERVSDAQVLGDFDVALNRGQDLTFWVSNGTARMVKNSFGPNHKTE